jgi:hypothetical protein
MISRRLQISQGKKEELRGQIQEEKITSAAVRREACNGATGDERNIFKI